MNAEQHKSPAVNPRLALRQTVHLLAVLAILVGGITLTGFSYYQRHKRESTQSAYANLSAIADLKAGQIANWVKERHGDAAVSQHKTQVRQFLAAPDNPALREELLDWMAISQRQYQYRALQLIDSRGVVRLAVPADTPPLAGGDAAQFQAALRATGIVYTDLHHNEASGLASMDMLVPIRATSSADQPAIGVLVFVIDPQTFLFPLVQSWPTPSRSAQTLLVRREGNEVVYLNELRPTKGTAQNLRLPLDSQRRLPAALAAQGIETVVDGFDFRGVPVLAATRKIPGTPWSMVAKVDQDEIYAPLRQSAATAATITALLLLAAVLAFVILQRQQAMKSQQRELAESRRAEEALRQSEERYRELVENANSAIIRWRRDGTITFFNDFAQRFFGYSAAEAVGKHVGMLVPDSETTGRTLETFVQDIVDHPERHVSVVNENVCRDGRRSWFTWTNKAVFDAQGRVAEILAIGSDITQRKRAEADLRESEERLRFALAISHTGAWDLDLVDHTAFRSLEHDRVFGYEELLPAWTYEMFLEHVVPEDRALVREKFQHSAETLSDWSFECRIRRVDGQVRWIWAAGRHRLDAGGKARRMAGVVQDITQRKQAEAALRENEARLRLAVAAANIGLWDWDLQTDQVFYSTEWKHQIGYGDEEIANRFEEWRSRVHPDDLEPMLQKIRGFLANPRGRHEGEFRFRHKDGSYRWICTQADVLRDATGKPVRMLGCHIDITERKRAEVELERTRDTLVEAQKIAHLGSFEYVAATQTTVWSEEEYRIYGLDPSEPSPAYAEMLAKCIHPGDAALLHETFTKAMQTRSVFELEHRIVRPDGSVGWVRDRARPFLDEQGELVRYVGTTLDITERKRAEAALRESEERFRTLVEQAPDGIFIQTQRRFAYVNAAMVRLLGASGPGQLLGETVESRLHPDSLALARERIRGLNESRLPQPPADLVYVRLDGLPCDVSVSGVPFEYKGDRGALVFVRDITARKQAEAALRESEERFRTMFEMASIGMAQADTHSARWLRVNRKLCEITGYAEAELLQLRIPEITHPEDRTKDVESFQRVVRGELPDYRLEKRYVRKDGTTAWVNVNMTIIRENGGQPLRTFATIEDITDRKRLEQERAAMDAQLRQQQKLESIGTLASGVAHEINNPITGVLNYAQLIQDRLPGDSPLIEFTGEIMHETQRVANIVSNLLTFARNEKQHHSPARVADIVEAVLSLVRSVIRHDQITLTVNVPPDLPLLKCRSQQIQQVIMNLVTNSRDALNERFPGHHPDKVLNLDAHLLEKAGRRWIRLTVEDHGTGIPPKVRERIFDPFFTTKEREKGTGLGLSISHGIVKEHHGEWTVESEPGRFTRMLVDLPLDNGWAI